MSGYSDTYQEAPGFELHELVHNAVVVVRGGWTEETFAALRSALREDVLLINLAGDETLETLDQVAMLEHGWVRAVQTPPEADG